MPWPIREVPFPLPSGQGYEVGIGYKIPLSYRYEDGTEWAIINKDRLSPEFLASGRDYAIVLILPPCWPWIVDQLASDSNGGWTVTGEFPNITVTPSINATNVYHGWITNGVISDDLEGRNYGN